MNRLMACQSELVAYKQRTQSTLHPPPPPPRRQVNTPSLSSQSSVEPMTYEVPGDPYANYARARAVPQPMYDRATTTASRPVPIQGPGARARTRALVLPTYGVPTDDVPISQPSGATDFYGVPQHQGQTQI
jgi:hypothetical protein